MCSYHQNCPYGDTGISNIEYDADCCGGDEFFPDNSQKQHSSSQSGFHDADRILLLNQSRSYDMVKEKKAGKKRMSFAVMMKSKNGIVACTDGRSTVYNGGPVISDNFQKVWKFSEKNIIITSTGLNEIQDYREALSVRCLKGIGIEELLSTAVHAWDGDDIYHLVSLIHSKITLPIYELRASNIGIYFQYGYLRGNIPIMASSNVSGCSQGFQIYIGENPQTISTGKHTEIVNNFAPIYPNESLEAMKRTTSFLVDTAINMENVCNPLHPVVGGEKFMEVLSIMP